MELQPYRRECLHLAVSLMQVARIWKLEAMEPNGIYASWPIPKSMHLNAVRIFSPMMQNPSSEVPEKNIVIEVSHRMADVCR
jgi:hypothetical protein